MARRARERGLREALETLVSERSVCLEAAAALSVAISESLGEFTPLTGGVRGGKSVGVFARGERGGLREAEETVVSERSVGCWSL